MTTTRTAPSTVVVVLVSTEDTQPALLGVFASYHAAAAAVRADAGSYDDATLAALVDYEDEYGVGFAVLDDDGWPSLRWSLQDTPVHTTATFGC